MRGTVRRCAGWQSVTGWSLIAQTQPLRPRPPSTPSPPPPTAHQLEPGCCCCVPAATVRSSTGSCWTSSTACGTPSASSAASVDVRWPTSASRATADSSAVKTSSGRPSRPPVRLSTQHLDNFNWIVLSWENSHSSWLFNCRLELKLDGVIAEPYRASVGLAIAGSTPYHTLVHYQRRASCSHKIYLMLHWYAGDLQQGIASDI